MFSMDQFVQVVDVIMGNLPFILFCPKSPMSQFSIDQFVQVVDVIMGNLPFILFCPKSETKEYDVLLFWSTNMDNAACKVQKTWKSVNEK